MFYKLSYSKFVLTLLVIVFFIPQSYSQTKKLKRPKSRVGISSVDTFVRESFDLYEKVYKYDGYAQSGTPLDDEDIDVLEDALTEMTALSDSAVDIASDLDGVGILKQGKATLQINKAKKALTYSIKTAKELLMGERNKKDNDSEDLDNDNDSDVVDSNNDDSSHESEEEPIDENASNENEEIDKVVINNKFDFVPGNKVLFFDDFNNDFVGDFPARWNTNGTGEVVTFNDDPEKWFELKPGGSSKYIPDIKNLPEDYTIEFDLRLENVTNKSTSTLSLELIISDDESFGFGKKHHIVFNMPVHQKHGDNIHIRNYFNNGGGGISNSIPIDIREALKKYPHVAISVNKQRFRVWVNDKKLTDIPRLITELNVLNYLKFRTIGFKADKERIFIKNLRVAEGGEDLRRKLLTDGKISTNGILFDSGSSTIKLQSYGIIRQIYQVLKQDNSLQLKIVGHTDSDGNDDTNLKLSKSRAEAVKQALIDVYKIDGSRLISEGKGENEPLADNTSSEGKAQNRRVEFIKL
ncbi:OmpA family protein [Psychroserpens sp. AS72]|uniref:OmpA family protein n=1 Tax=Psychroserpens sp. AS72 TaxID=3135775 RepID=UPI00316BFB80